MKRRGWLVLATLTILFAGCATTAHKDALKRFGETGRSIQPHLKPPADPSVEALYSAFDSAVTEALKAGE